MGIWQRLGRVFKASFNDFTRGNDFSEPQNNSRSRRTDSSEENDPYFDDAWEELNDFLGGSSREKANEEASDKTRREENLRKNPVPKELEADFAELGLAHDASVQDLKNAYKKLLKIHHPDRHARHEGNMKKATEKCARVNASYERLMKWFDSAHSP